MEKVSLLVCSLSYILVGVIIGYTIGVVSESAEYDQLQEEIRECQTSEFQWKGDLGDLAKILCEQEGIEFNIDIPTKGYLLTCPHCIKGGAFVQQSSSGSMCYNFHYKPENVLPNRKRTDSIDLLEDYRGQTYCGKCMYPVGTDWKIIDLMRG